MLYKQRIILEPFLTILLIYWLFSLEIKFLVWFLSNSRPYGDIWEPFSDCIILIFFEDAKYRSHLFTRVLKFWKGTDGPSNKLLFSYVRNNTENTFETVYNKLNIISNCRIFSNFNFKHILRKIRFSLNNLFDGQGNIEE